MTAKLFSSIKVLTQTVVYLNPGPSDLLSSTLEQLNVIIWVSYYICTMLPPTGSLKNVLCVESAEVQHPNITETTHHTTLAHSPIQSQNSIYNQRHSNIQIRLFHLFMRFFKCGSNCSASMDHSHTGHSLSIH